MVSLTRRQRGIRRNIRKYGMIIVTVRSSSELQSLINDVTKALSDGVFRTAWQGKLRMTYGSVDGEYVEGKKRTIALIKIAQLQRGDYLRNRVEMSPVSSRFTSRNIELRAKGAAVIIPHAKDDLAHAFSCTSAVIEQGNYRHISLHEGLLEVRND